MLPSFFDYGPFNVEAHRSLSEQLEQARGNSARPPTSRSPAIFIYPAPGAATPTSRELAPLAESDSGAAVGQGLCSAGAPVRHRTAARGVSRWRHFDGIDHDPCAARHRQSGLEPMRRSHGVPGTVAALTAQGALRSTHGSACPTICTPSPRRSARFPRRRAQHAASGGIDLAPTILTLLGLDVPAWIDGRVLWEDAAEPSGESPLPQTIEVVPSSRHSNGFAPRLQLHLVGTTAYVHAVTNGRAVSYRQSRCGEVVCAAQRSFPPCALATGPARC